MGESHWAWQGLGAQLQGSVDRGTRCGSRKVCIRQGDLLPSRGYIGSRRVSRVGGVSEGRVPGALYAHTLVLSSAPDPTQQAGSCENSLPGEKRQRQHMRQSNTRERLGDVALAGN
ncbi:hypothetical protein NDU88_005111 [Pleurodeles waltl]|uniref:Uncharacterized protein n=1 Tax=Pleurodeles waltl TaxID=8319 RepID=A0AAV7TUQ1_PLEWA|nr:hypothetical protein NDU88_005111 [Pleurodeles waltl]